MEHLKIHRLTLMTALQASGVVIVIDVIRAFTVAAYAFARGAGRLWLVPTVEEAFALKEREPAALLIGEVDGRLIPGFDLNNSPALMARSDVQGKLLIQRTGAGTQGAVSAINAKHLLVCSLVNARPTALYAHKLAEESNGIITLLPTASLTPEDDHPIEDDICADYLEALLLQKGDAADILAGGIARLQASGRLQLFELGYPDFPPEDVTAFLDIDRFNFAMQGKHKQWGEITYVDVEKVDMKA
jgi:2-phosphosulfolactate phosphatase